MQITTIGLDIAKNVFQAHGIDAAEKVVVRKQLRRGQVLGFFKALPPCLVGIESQGVADAEHTARRSANGRTRGLGLCRCFLGAAPENARLPGRCAIMLRFAKRPWVRAGVKGRLSASIVAQQLSSGRTSPVCGL